LDFTLFSEIAEDEEEQGLVWSDAAGRIVVEFAKDSEPTCAVWSGQSRFGSNWFWLIVPERHAVNAVFGAGGPDIGGSA
jgi:hypothetical protein